MNFSIKNYQGIIFDLDGVIYNGNNLLPGAKELIDNLRQNSISFVFLTNNSSKSVADVTAKLNNIGLSGIQETQVLTSAVAVGLWLKKNISMDQKVFIYGMKGLKEQVTKLGYQTTEDPDADLVVAGLNMHLTYEQITNASFAIQKGARLIASNIDRTYPTERGLLPGAGSTLKSLTHASGVEPEVVLGKPSKDFFQMAKDLLNLPSHQILMIGDRLDTDILGANEIGLDTALVLTGVTRKEELADSSIQPNFIFESLLEIQL